MTGELYARLLPCRIYSEKLKLTSDSGAGVLKYWPDFFEGVITGVKESDRYISVEFPKRGKVMFDRIVQLLRWGVDIKSIDLREVEVDS